MIGNSTAIAEVFSRIDSKFDLMCSQHAFVFPQTWFVFRCCLKEWTSAEQARSKGVRGVLTLQHPRHTTVVEGEGRGRREEGGTGKREEEVCGASHVMVRQHIAHDGGIGDRLQTDRLSMLALSIFVFVMNMVSRTIGRYVRGLPRAANRGNDLERILLRVLRDLCFLLESG